MRDVEGSTLLPIVESALPSTWPDGVHIGLRPLTPPPLDGVNVALRPFMPPPLDDVKSCEGDVEGYTLLPVIESALSSTWLDGVDMGFKPFSARQEELPAAAAGLLGTCPGRQPWQGSCAIHCAGNGWKSLSHRSEW